VRMSFCLRGWALIRVFVDVASGLAIYSDGTQEERQLSTEEVDAGDKDAAAR
jgi:hypothetical protein